MKKGIISCEDIDRLMHIKKQELNLKQQIEHVRKTGSKSIKELSRMIDTLSELQCQKENLIRSM